ncbi:aldose epimerase family protein [Shewanella xiamenensis]|uniref:aldose epimerase family protein n=1 Tax=Shewanella xiamenensis TaxID=332186 RepID=UPI0024A6EA2D|nr:aldose epimerase family protein [Shewanella xiamenensis]MDI5837050.1 galactose mutarotase [Shewanella xiamenensis]MDI5841289.1 galactose mutarotase [Shewanella xiamenensis]MDI5848995.1 galactose mutarotase [Shewanella xiamenensis]MDI5860903.1 galactose mutarotase [Shewanella xiamenensis]MDI5868613.1 galactose mutarotase [Shewanella xiamenensis]
MVRFSVLDPWTDPRGGEIERVRIDNGIIALEVLSLGGIIRALWTPDKQGERANIVLGCDSAEDYLTQNAHLGAIAGRFANRIALGKLQYQGQTYQLDINQASNCLHGGREGFNRKNWHLGPLPDGVRLTLVSPDGDMGFPGNCTVQLDYRLAANNLYVEMLATVDKPCPVSLTQHSYFNLDGTSNNYQHQMQIDATRYLTMNEVGIPTGIAEVKDSIFDLTQGVTLGEKLHAPELTSTQGYDHCYLMDNPDGSLRRFGCLSSPVSGRAMTVFTNQPGVQLYCANFLAGTVGRNQQSLHQHQGVCIEPQKLPDSPNQPQLGDDAWLAPGKIYHHISRYQFDIVD